MLREIEAAVAAVQDEDAENPAPIQECEGVVRLPAFRDDQYQWQGATITRMGGEYITQLDDGRQFVSATAGEAATVFMSDADVWADPPVRAVDKTAA